MEDWKIARKKCRKFGKKLSDKNGPKNAIRNFARNNFGRGCDPDSGQPRDKL